MAVSLSGLGAFVYVKKAWEELSVVDESTMEEHNLLAELGWLPLLCLMSFIISYSIGFGAVPQLVMGELFPSEYRHRMGTISVSFSVLCTFVVVRTFPLMATTMGLASVYGIYATCCLTAVVFVGIFLPETKGKTLEEISSFFGQSQPKDMAAEDPCIRLEHKAEPQDSSLADGFPMITKPK
jgi:facilitated trehalose transporter